MPKRKSKSLPKPRVAFSESDSEYDDEIQTFYKQKDKILLDSDHQEASDSTEDEEVYRLEESSDDDEETAQMQQQLRQLKRNKNKKKLGSDLEDDTEDEALPDARAWGSERSWFFGGDVRDKKIILSGDEDAAGSAALEEKEMLEIEKRQQAHSSSADYMPYLLKKKTEEETKKGEKKKKKKTEEKKSKKTEKKKSKKVEEKELSDSETEKRKKKKDKKKKAKSDENGLDGYEKVKLETDFSGLPDGTELERLREMHPEYAVIANDFNLKMKEFQERIIPLMSLVKEGKMDGLGATYVRMKYHIIANYLICGGFYVYFLIKQTPRLHFHPVLKRLVELQNFYKRLEPLDNRLKAVIDEILERKRQGLEIGKITSTVHDPNADTSTTTKRKKKTRKTRLDEGPSAKKQKVMQDFEEDEEDEGVDDTEMNFDNDDTAEGDDEQMRRAITYQMEKNKGLVAHKKKELKNPRVKHRNKYRRALIRRKGQVRDYKPPKTAYRGELTGIRAGIIRSRKF